MRLQNVADDNTGAELKSFLDWMCGIGDETIGGPNDGKASIDLLEDVLIRGSGDAIEVIVNAIYPVFRRHVAFLQGSAIWAPTLQAVDAINEYIISLNDSEGRVYLSSDATCKADEIGDVVGNIYSSEFLNGIRCSGVLNHELTLKSGVPVMLLRNIDHASGLCIGTRLIITRLANHVLAAQILADANAGLKVLILRLPFKFQRRQFSLIVSYVMTINKSKGHSLSHVGHSLSHVGLLLKKSVFSHNQFYVAVSRVMSQLGLNILICDKDGKPTNTAINVVYKEVIKNL